ncbi:uncharacterized protein LOC127464285 isoform X5 [Manacus candei]|uniref:uncharacterized protein LOC127464285 isoform X4 n=1 Tax=Manacus candei TaxID=415023 RepID=UPI0022269848|nr:uncharacterized protein LOC127464285 isoform X4 [Manacus candei]XP_051630528.1 uncharacterized protein LOC127464285 isoform X5 [Manacus candei]
MMSLEKQEGCSQGMISLEKQEGCSQGMISLEKQEGCSQGMISLEKQEGCSQGMISLEKQEGCSQGMISLEKQEGCSQAGKSLGCPGCPWDAPGGQRDNDPKAMEFPGAGKTGREWSWNTWEGDTGLSPRAEEKSWIPSFSGLDPGFPWTHPCPGMFQEGRGTMIPKPWSSLELGKQAGNGPGILGKVTLVCHLERRRRAGSRVSLDEILVFLGHIPALGYSRGQGDNDPKAMEFPGAGKTGWEWSWNTWEGDTGLSPRAEKSWIPSFPGFYPGFPWTHPCPGMLQRARGTMIPKPWSSLEPGKQGMVLEYLGR